jgi:predicted phosphodiesterase
MFEQLTQHFNSHGKTHSWYELALMYNILPEGSRKQRSDKVRRFYYRTFTPATTKSNTLLQEFQEFIELKKSKIKITPYLSGDPNNVLVIGDTHIPHQHPEYLNFLQQLQIKWNCGKVIHIGDVVDFSSTTYHDTHPELPSPAYEFEYTKLELEKWKQAFPNMIVTIGNHDRRVTRKQKSNQIITSWQKSFNDIFDTEWEFVPEYYHNNIYFCHGEGATARVTSLQKQCSVVQGHRHSETYIDFPAKNLFAVQCPLGVNRESLAFEYAKVDPKEWTIGACVIVNGIPIIERL